MQIATFTPGTEMAGKKITREADALMLRGTVRSRLRRSWGTTDRGASSG